MTEPQKIDFAKLIAEIEAAGITPYKLSQMMHRQLVQVRRWKEGSEPRHYEGQMLMMIHAEYVPGSTWNDTTVNDGQMITGVTVSTTSVQT